MSIKISEKIRLVAQPRASYYCSFDRDRCETTALSTRAYISCYSHCNKYNWTPRELRSVAIDAELKTEKHGATDVRLAITQ